MCSRAPVLNNAEGYARKLQHDRTVTNSRQHEFNFKRPIMHFWQYICELVKHCHVFCLGGARESFFLSSRYTEYYLAIKNARGSQKAFKHGCLIMYQ